MTTRRLGKIIEILLKEDENSVIDYSNQGMRIEGNFSKLSDGDKTILSVNLEIPKEQIKENYVEVEVI